jgi:phosphogluconate dehydratase
MPELHKLTPSLTSVLGRGHRVALVTDGRMSGASGKVPAAIQVTPECLAGGPLARVRDGDVLRVDTITGELQALVEPAAWEARTVQPPPIERTGFGRELFTVFRANVSGAEQGGSPAVTWDEVAEARAVATAEAGVDERGR